MRQLHENAAAEKDHVRPAIEMLALKPNVKDLRPRDEFSGFDGGSNIPVRERIVSFPWIGRAYSRRMRRALESLGLKIVMPPEITDETIKLGVRHSADMMCFPFKVTLGNMIESLEKGANTLLMYDSCGECRQRHYFRIQEFTLREMGYAFEMVSFNGRSFVPVMKKLSGRSTLAAYRALRDLVGGVRRIDERSYRWSPGAVNIGLIGEIFTCCEERVNYGLVHRLRKMEVNPVNTACLSEFIFDDDRGIYLLHPLKAFKKSGKEKYMEAARKYLNGPLGGHGVENIGNLLWMRDREVDGVIHLLPLSCMPEATVEPIINSLCQKAGIPLLRILIDETNSISNIETRVETFVELIKRKRRLDKEGGTGTSLPRGGRHEVLARN